MAETDAKIQDNAYFYGLRTEDITWDFRYEDTKTFTHGIHSYPAMMIPQVARRLIDNYSSEGDVVLDPFCGSGSVLVEARIAKRYSWGIDLNPLATLVAHVKTTLINPKVLHDDFVNILYQISKMDGTQVSQPDFFNLHFWFKDNIINELARLKAAILALERKESRQFFLVTFSEIVRLVSNSRIGEFKLFRYSKEKLEKHNPEPLKLFISKALNNIEGMKDFYDACSKNYWCRIIDADSTIPIAEIPAESVDMVITSPPYGDSRTTVAYGQFSRLSLQWLGLAEDRARGLDDELLGGKPYRFEDTTLNSPTLDVTLDYIAKQDFRRAQQIKAFYIDLGRSLKTMGHYLKHNSHACIVIGNRRVKGMQLQTDVIICEIARDLGFNPEEIIVRNIPNKTMPLRNSPTNVKGLLEDTMHKEYIVILQKI